MLKIRRPDWGWLSKFVPIVLFVLGTAVLYVWHLGRLTVGLSPAEAVARATSRSFHSLWINPVYAPQSLLQYNIQAAGHHGAFWARLPSVIFALILLTLFYLLARIWFGRMTGLLAAIMLATTPWVILLARNATPDILLLAPIAIWLAYDWLKRARPKQQDWAWLGLVIAAALSLYVPGIVWLLLAAAIINRKRLEGLLRGLTRAYLFGGLALGLVLILPIIFASVSDFGVAKSLLLWPAHWQTPLTTFKSIVWAALALVWRAPYHIPIIIGRLPVLDVAQIVLIIFGAVALWNKARNQLFTLLALIALAVIGAGLDHNLILVTLALPALAILVAAGLRYLYAEWRNVFPLNPIPRALAITLLVLLVGLHVFLGARYGLAAWPHTVATRQTYVIK